MKNNDNRQAFNDLLERVSSLEADKDAFLKAARLQRTERQPLSEEKFTALLWLIGICTFIMAVAMVIIIIHVF